MNKNIVVNFGPQHPAAHGVLRMILQLEGQIVQRTDIHIGLLHRGSEHLIETKHFEKSIPYFDRLDYVSMLCQEHTYCLAIESILGINSKNITVNFIRIIFDEITRILNHFLAVSCHALDIGSMSSLFWAFEDREKLMEFYERVSGARMHAAFHRPVSTFTYNIDKQLLYDILYFTKECFKTLNEMHNLLTYNKIWKQRLTNVGLLSYLDCQNYSLTGVLLRSTGIKKDLRLSDRNIYSSYNLIDFKSYIGINGDSYDRYLMRMLEMGESLNIISKVTYLLLNNFKDFVVLKPLNSLLHKNDLLLENKHKYSSMEDLISHFVDWHCGSYVGKNIDLAYIESPKGEFGVTLVANNSNKPQKCKIRSPSYYSLQSIVKLAKGHYLADLAALIGTIDIVFGEIDR